MEGFMQKSNVSPLPLGRGFLFEVKAEDVENKSCGQLSWGGGVSSTRLIYK